MSEATQHPSPTQPADHPEVQPSAHESSPRKATPFLMFNDQLEAAIELYSAVFPETRALKVRRAGPEGPLVSAELLIGGQLFFAFNGGPHFRFSEAFSILIDCVDQAEVDRYWQALVDAGATPSMCGWITDPFGLSWQIVPRRFTELVSDANPGKVQAVIAAMMKMQKLVVADLQAAYDAAH